MKDWRWTLGLTCCALGLGALLYLVGAFVPCTDYRALRKGPLQVQSAVLLGSCIDMRRVSVLAHKVHLLLLPDTALCVSRSCRC